MQQPTPEQYNLPLTRWQNVWRFALALAISGLVWSQVALREWRHDPVLLWIDLGLGAVSLSLAPYRRRWPMPVALLGAAFGVLSASCSGPATLAAVSLATRRDLPKIITVGVVGVAGSIAMNALEPWATDGPWWVDLAFAVVFTIAMMATGMYVGSRRELVWSLRERAEQAEQQQQLQVGQARALERERIAREMHDVLAHRISLVTMHAGALAYRTDLSPEQVRETAEIISGKAHEALSDLRTILGTLREDEPMRPQPTLVDLRDLIAEATTSGMTVRLDDALLDLRAVPESTGRTVYRIVQEALTNARKHAPGAAVEIGVCGALGEGLTVAVRNNRTRLAPSAEGSGLGLVGMRERAELAGGRLDVRDDGSTFALEGWLPWPT
ncbi:sensor histidine kinase [Nocardioides terrisoli]|uniref:sensor histidine kinase n=1 Tax=Nocardioides terrisoli TaxID=3388267 RepID=UPI00287B5F94|nr:histidine kinase [Nocardioides marmorisolisilvae]